MSFFSKKKKEDTIQNPMNLKEGQLLNLDTLDEKDLQFKVVQIAEWDRTIAGEKHTFTDYSCEAKPAIGEGTVKMRVRMNPTADKLPVGINQKILKLQLIDEAEWQNDVDGTEFSLYNSLTVPNPDKKPDGPDFISYNDDDTVKAQWWRINDVHSSYDARVSTIKNGQRQYKEVEYWDFYREVDVPGGKALEYLFVEMDKAYHTFQFWNGTEVDESEVS